MKLNWLTIKENLPPDELLRVKDINGNEGYAQPTYYPFDVVKMEGDERKPYGCRGTIVFNDNNELKWDGGWLVNCDSFCSSSIDSEITHFLKIDK